MNRSRFLNERGGAVTAAAFRRIALALDGVVEGGHHGHADFRVGGRVFATLGYPDTSHGMVKLTPEQQRAQIQDEPEAFVTVKGKWGEGGATLVRLRAADEETLGQALTLAWQNVAARQPARGSARRKTR
jgi:hypothetical protein